MMVAKAVTVLLGLVVRMFGRMDERMVVAGLARAGCTPADPPSIFTATYKFAGDGAVAESTHLPALGQKIEGFVGVNRYIPVMDPPLNTAAHKKFYDDASARLKQIDPTGPLPDRYVQSNYEAVNFLKLVPPRPPHRSVAAAASQELPDPMLGLISPQNQELRQHPTVCLRIQQQLS